MVHIIGKNKLQNNLLISFLKKNNELEAKFSQKLELESSIFKNGPTSLILFLIDCEKCGTEELLDKINSCRTSIPSKCFVALFNIDPKMKIEKMALTNNINGLFYKEDPPDLISKGISAILKGDIWFSRKTLKKQILESTRSIDNVPPNNLTIREKEILSLIASGYYNQEIADELFISLHTVKTHIYNIFKKTNIANRLQAALLCVRYL